MSKAFNCKIYDWNKVIENDFEDFDVIISAASNCHHLIKNVQPSNKKLLLIDLAIPSNIDKSITEGENVVFYDLDLISVDLEETKEKRLAAIDEVDIIITDEFNQFKKWLEDATLRDNLIKSKQSINQKVRQYFIDNDEELDDQKIQDVTNKVMRKLMAKTNTKVSIQKIDSIIAQQAHLLYEI